MLERLGITNGVLQGSVSNEDRERAIDLFRDGTLRVLLAQVKVAREAIDLSNSSTSIYFSNSHSFDDRSQSEDRILNPAKKEPLLYLDLVSENTVDEDIVELLKEKKMNSRFFLRELLSKLKEGDHGG
jgi:SNF2 family DNA or RNA helicase